MKCSKAETEWAWMKKGGEHVHGPFKTRELAILDAREEGPEVIEVGRVTRPEAEEYVDFDLSQMLERMEESFCEDFLSDSSCFHALDAEEAQASLEAILRGWAREHIGCEVEWYLAGEDCETITLEPVAA